MLLRHSFANYNIININVAQPFCLIATHGAICHGICLESTLQDFISFSFLFFITELAITHIILQEAIICGYLLGKEQ